jgi:hypothetical protein
MSTIKPQTGFLAFFDILGYKQIIMNNDIHKTAQLVSDTLVNIPTTIINNVRGIEQNAIDGPGSGQSAWKATLAKIDWLIFSDSILVSLPFDPQASLIELLQSYAAFVTVCATLMNKTYDAGFPLRGAISVGEFFIEERTFAGKPIINAYRTAQELEFSGCILDEDANNFISQLRKEVVHKGLSNLLTMLDQTTILYMVPQKDDTSDRRRTINWVSLALPGFSKVEGNVRDYVTTSFLKHNKIAVPQVQGKINNTEMFVRHVLTNLKIQPWSI